MLELVGDFDAWVHRRVETYCFGAEDPSVFVRRKSIDFSLPPEAAKELSAGAGACAVPITLVNKWTLQRFDIRDEGENAIPLLARDEHGPLTAGMLIALAYTVCTGVLPPRSTEIIPLEIEEDLRAVVSEEGDTAVSICEQLGALATGGDTPKQEIERVVMWRRRLVTDEAFMELAYELARNFVVMVLCPAPIEGRRILKMTYEMPVGRPASRRIGTRWSDLRTKLRRWSSDDTWLHPNGHRSPVVGTLTLSSSCETVTVGTRQSEASAECVSVRIVTPQHREETFVLGTQDVQELPNMPEGEYAPHPCACRLSATEREYHESRDRPPRASKGVDPVQSASCQRQAAKVDRNPAADAHMGSQAQSRPSLAVSVAPDQVQAWRGRKLSFRVRGPSWAAGYASQGRRRPARRARHIVLHTVQRSHLYVPAAACEPATGYVLVNLRPRAETVVRGATITAGIATFAVLAVAIHWQVTGHAGSDGLALLLGLPGLLAAYFAYAVPSSVTNYLIVVLRVVALAPGVMAFAAAALVLDGDAESWALATLESLLGAMALVTFILCVALRFSLHPAEQRSTPVAQSPGFAKRYLERVGRK